MISPEYLLREVNELTPTSLSGVSTVDSGVVRACFVMVEPDFAPFWSKESIRGALGSDPLVEEDARFLELVGVWYLILVVQGSK